MNIPIFLSSDNNYAPFVATTIASICDNTKSFCEFYILDSEITGEDKIKICELQNKFTNFSIEFIAIDGEKYFKDFPEINYITKSMYNRFLIPDLKPEIDRALYSDVDVIVMGDIKEMFGEELENYSLGAIWEEFAETTENIKRKQILKLSEKHKYFSSGNLLINSQLWREKKVLNNLLKISAKYNNCLNTPDMDVLNIYFDNNYKILSPKYCWINQNYDFYNETPEIIVRHFNGPIKPWHLHPDLNEDRRLAFTLDFKKFWHYAKLTEFYNDLLDKTIYKNNSELKKYLVLNLMKEKANARSK